MLFDTFEPSGDLWRRMTTANLVNTGADDLSIVRPQDITFYVLLLSLCAGNSPVTGEFPSQRPVTRIFVVFFDLHMNKRLSKQSICRWFRRHGAHYDVSVIRT